MISIVTVTQLCRKETIKLTATYINYQTYKDKIKEWVIVEGSKNEEDAEKNKKYIDDLSCDVQIKYIPFVENSKIGALRNRCNKNANEEYIVCMDDDDYYSNTYIEEHFKALQKTELSGISDTYMHEFYLGKSYRFKVGRENFSLNCSLGYKKSYSQTHFYDETVGNAEEESFNNCTSTIMTQIDPKSMCLNSHSTNTYNKRQLSIAYHNGTYSRLNEEKCIIPEEFLNKYDIIFETYKKCKYDIIYFGGDSVEWGPNGMLQGGLGGSEQAVVHLTENWIKMGYTVAVYGNVKECSWNGVDYIHWNKFNFMENFNILISWRLMGLSILHHFIDKMKFVKFFIDIHDNTKTINDFNFILKKIENRIDYVMLKSEFNKREFLNNCDVKEKCIVIPNGIRFNEFSALSYFSYKRDRNKFIYASCYTRGLDRILKYMWPEILKTNPLAELYICYGMNLIGNEEYKNYIIHLIGKSVNVMNMGRIDMQRVAKLKFECGWHLYPTDVDSEIDCISIRESLYCGCMPILSNRGVFSERNGIHFDIDFTSEENMRNTGLLIGNLSRIVEDQFNNFVSQQIKSDKNMIGWDVVAKKWDELFKGNLNAVEKHLLNLSTTCKIPDKHVNFLHKLKNDMNFNPKVIYDIGSCVLHWTKESKNIWKDSEIILFEAMPEVEFLYKNNKYNIGILTDEDNKKVKWYQNIDEPAGNSYYKEIWNKKSEELFPENSYVEREGNTLDSIVLQNKFPYPDLIKIDSQGSEIDILLGATNVLKHVKCIIVELQHVNYNKNAKKCDESIKIIENLGFTCVAERFNSTEVDADYCFFRNLE